MFKYVFKLFGDGIWENGLVFSEGNQYSIFLFFALVLCIAAEAYFIGAFNTAEMISKFVYKEDIRTKGSGNAGATNMMRTYGMGPAVATLCGDMFKTMLAMVAGTLVLGINGAYIAGLFAVLGHVAPVYYRFKGGKGVATSAMIILYLDLKVFAILLILFVFIVWATKYLSLGSVIGLLVYPLLSYRNDTIIADRPLRLIISLVIALIVVFMHRENIKRIMEGKENKFSFKRTKKKKANEAEKDPDNNAETEETKDVSGNSEKKKTKK